MHISKEKILRWHPEFDVETCKVIEQAELPQPPDVERMTSAKDVLDKAKSLIQLRYSHGESIAAISRSKDDFKECFSKKR